MARSLVCKVFLIAGIVALGPGGVHGESPTIEPLPKEWAPLAMITGFHSLVHKKSGLVLRVLEADGSSSAAENPVSLFIVATNQGTSDLREYVWKLPRGVARVKKVTSSTCGLDIVADVDAADGEQRVVGQKPRVIKACFVDAKGELESHLRLLEADGA